MKWRNLLRVLVCGLALDASALPTYANWLYTPGAGPSAFVSFNSTTTPAGTGLCAAANTDCTATVPINTAGAQLFNSTTPGVVSLNTTPSLANGSGVVPTQGGSVLAANNPLPAQLSQAGAALSATNPLFTNISVGSAAIGATNGLYTNILQGNAVLAAGNPIFVSPGTGATWGLAAGTNIIGKVGIDQTTPGTTNGVQVNAALPAGTNLMGKVGIDQTTVGTTNGVSLAQIGATTVATGNGVSGAGSQRVNIASDNTAFAVNATLQASATTAIGKVDPNTIGNWGLQVSTQNSATPTNGALVLGQFNTSPTTITSGNVSPLQMDANGNLLVNIKAGAGSGGTALADGATFTIGTTSETPAACTYVSGGITVTSGKSSVLSCTSTASLHTTVDNAATYVTSAADAQATSSSAGAPVVNFGYVYNGSTWDRMRSTGSDGGLVVGGSAKGGLAVVNGGSFYEAVAASQTATVLQSSTGAAGDYLSHCVIYPASTSPGVVTVFDSTNTAANSAILFAGGSTSLSNLAPIPIPVGAVSVNGAWKVTTGPNVSVVCYGKFS
jgi:hypothetical protein